ncbi:MAG: DUF3810 domain-containing protein [bacterium]
MIRYLRAKEFPLISVLVLAGLGVALPLLSAHPRLVENAYTHFLYANLTKGMTAFAGAFTFSVSEIALYASILGLLLLLAAAIVQKKWRHMLALATRSMALAATWFYLGWGCNYFRLPLAEQLQLQSGSASSDSSALRDDLLWSLTAANAVWREIPAWDLVRLDEEIERSYRLVCDTLGIALMPGERRPKFLLFPGLFNYTLTSGMFGPFFHEVHLNSGLLPVEIPFVLAHEKAHQMGFAREAEANFLAALVCWMSPDSAVQYSGHFSILGHFWIRAALMNGSETLLEELRPEVRADFTAVRQRLQRYQGAVSEISHRSYDAYLRANRVAGGMQNYNDVVDLIMRWRRQLLTKNHSAGENVVR